MKRSPVNRSSVRRGSQAVEFALALPVLLAMIAGVVDVGQYLMVTEGLVSAVAEGARAGALTEPATGASATAVTVADTAWTATGLPGELTLKTTLSGTKPDRRIKVTGNVDYTPFFGFLTLPSSITYDYTLRLLDQD